MKHDRPLLVYLIVLGLGLLAFTPAVSAFSLSQTGSVSVRIDAPASVIVKSRVTVTVTADKTAKIYLYIDRALKAQTYGRKLTYTFIAGQVAEYQLSAVGSVSHFGNSIIGSDSSTIHVKSTYDYGADGARHPADSDLHAFALKALKYGYKRLGIETNRPTTAQKVKALNEFAMSVLSHFYEPDTDAKTDLEVLPAFGRFDPHSTQPYRPGHNGVPDVSFDCRDMAAFVSGLARSVHLRSMMLSIQDGRRQHMVTLVYGITRIYNGNSNNGWFLIDAAYLRSGYSTLEEIQSKYAPQGHDHNLERFNIIWDITPTHWGTGAEKQETAWIDWDDGWNGIIATNDKFIDPPGIALYASNPYGFTCSYNPSGITI